MKLTAKSLLPLSLVFALVTSTHAQYWQASGSHIYNSNSGSVGIGGVPNPDYTLDVIGTWAFRQTGYFYSTLYAYEQSSGQYLHFFTAGGRGYVGMNSTNDLVLQSYGGKVGIGTSSPEQKLDVRGNLLLESGGSPVIYTGTGTSELNRYLQLINSAGSANASGLKAGGILVADSYSYANPGKNDLIVKGKVGIGAVSLLNTFQIGSNPNAYNGNDLVISNTTGSFAINNTSGETNLHGSRDITLKPGDALAFIAKANGNIGIGTTTPDSKLTVKGTIHAEEVKVDLNVPGPDYVFEENYPLRSLEETKAYIEQNKHLPGVPSSTEMQQNGVNLLEMNMKLLEKVEELTLHLIEQENARKKMEIEFSRRIKELEKQLNQSSK